MKRSSYNEDLRHIQWLARRYSQIHRIPLNILLISERSMQKITSRLSVKNTFFILNNYFGSIDNLLDEINWAKKRISRENSAFEFEIYLNATKNSWTACGLQEGFLEYSDKTYQEVLSFKTHFMPKNLFDLAAICYTNQSAADPDYIHKRIECEEYVNLLETLTKEEQDKFFQKSVYPGQAEKSILFPKTTLLSLFLAELLDNDKAVSLWNAKELQKQYSAFKLNKTGDKLGLQFIAWLIGQNYKQGYSYNSDVFLEPQKSHSRLHAHWLKETGFIELYTKYTKVELLKNMYLLNSEKFLEVADVLASTGFKLIKIED